MLFDSDSHGLDLLRFSSKDVKRAADTEARLPAPPPPPAVPGCPSSQPQPEPPAAAPAERSQSSGGSRNLVPSTISKAPHYYTTWASQGYMSGDCLDNLTVDYIFSHQGNNGQQQALDSDYLFGKEGLPGSGWLKAFYPASRKELFFMLDQGYATGDGKIEPNPLHFPRKITVLCQVDCASRLANLKSVNVAEWNQSDPGERLMSFQAAVKAEGWRGLGLWNRMSDPEYAVQAAQWSKAAGITYWKIDGPDMNCACSNAAKKVFPELIIEHGSCPVAGCPLNDPSGGKVYTASAAAAVIPTLGCSDVLRSYDTVPTLSTPTTLSRLSTILHMANTTLPPGTNLAMLNGDAESIVTASLGCTLGVMRSPLVGLRPKFKDKGMSDAVR